MDDTTNGFSHPRSVHVSAAALTLARAFARAAGAMHNDRRVVAFDWCERISERAGSEQQERQLGPCLTIGAYRIDQVPGDAVTTSDGLALTIRIPDTAWPYSTHRVIDVDEGKPFGLTLL